MTAAVDEVCREFGNVEPEILPDDTSPEKVATELVSPSLFAAERVLVVADARRWFGAPRPAGAPADNNEAPDCRPLVEVLSSGVPDGVGLVMGAWCGRRPGGALVDAFGTAGTFDWVALPPPPKPWEDTLLSREQEQLLGALLERAAAGVTFGPGARRLLLERLGFAPRLLVQEVRKLAGAAGNGAVDEALVRSLTFPRERSLEVVRDAVIERRPGPLMDLIAAAAAGAPVNDWQGRRVDGQGVSVIVHSQVSRLLLQMLYLRRLVAGLGGTDEMTPERTAAKGWYARRFKSKLAPGLLAALADDAPSPLVPSSKRPPSPFTLGAVFAGAGRYSDDELAAAVVEAAEVEARIRSKEYALEALTVWLARFVASA